MIQENESSFLKFYSKLPRSNLHIATHVSVFQIFIHSQQAQTHVNSKKFKIICKVLESIANSANSHANMELDISSDSRRNLFNHTARFWANVPFEIYFSNGTNTLAKIVDNQSPVWDGPANTYCKFLWVYTNSKEPLLLDLIVVTNGGDGPSVATEPGSAPTDKGVRFERLKLFKQGQAWNRIDKYHFYQELDKLSALLPKLTTEKGVSSIPSNMSTFKLAKKPKYFAIDLDGTFLSFNKEFLLKNVQSFEKARKAGYNPLFCTGRSHNAMFDHFNEVFEENTTYRGFPGVFNNGSVVYNHKGEIISETFFSREYLSRLTTYIKKNGLEDGFLFHDVDNYYCLADPCKVTSMIFLFYKSFQPKVVTPEEILDKKVVMIYFYKAETEFAGFVNHIDHISKVTIYQLFTEIVPPKVSKSSGVKAIMDHYKLDEDSLFFVGDGENDIEVMNMLNYSFAVGDAPDFVKKHAKYILDYPHTKGAVHHLLDTVFDL